MNLLFICGKNKLRSPTAQALFSAYPGQQALSCGINRDAETPLSGDLIEWADILFVMEKNQRNKVMSKYKNLLKDKKLICLDIADRYRYMDPALIKILTSRVSPYLR
ncbi:phosphotyrosine protein phosphatase [bacterium (Candidatus Blackallbacteria) CG17_big_fil_post_rev_8_21_14_2_50_48_46]|uniref:Phosphotyrosine protein phosphatase n=1 Tax=bacterium (Candidatus Blackallbacteria) CG17_big_fil_post_rev_8_21_14_2_50_48_46 TaxID=2014261 RepID=A0A2M7GAD8_9BACT|nr:MAG: phosphotyrosine protein phosphatase [bacterium (Candidatus Blackallbacteria) CG18_big_fil_WC_8_21_14_2_50_49_26]PIW19108.1 MAG: phosphotyrosine protein phosphatase [bacterium (Candidatus Blackallbacteria) CG17_big_fil_post_rev_8_21_14_2_50_48_46]PIW44707.1 MAG: phosphotyrosine protein phosphatase [bacterium (Candidatus Blackallbacteria) CG13_big_fil_rev_8_21_14_2_50_49_14]